MKKTLILLAVAALAQPGSGYGQDEKKTPDEKPPAKKPADLESRVAALEMQIAALTKSIEALNQKLDGNDTTLKKLPKADPSGGTEQKVMRPVIDGGNGSNGRLMITNSTGCDQFLYINCRLWRVVSGKSYAAVPRGNVIVQRPGGAAQTLGDWKTEADGTYVVRYSYPQSTAVTVLSPVIVWP